MVMFDNALKLFHSENCTHVRLEQSTDGNLTNCVKAPIVNYRIFGAASGVGDRCKNILSVKNLYPVPVTEYGVTISQVDDNTLELDGTFTGGTSNRWVFSKYVNIPTDRTKTYTLRCSHISGSITANEGSSHLFYPSKSDIAGKVEANFYPVGLNEADTVNSSNVIGKDYISRFVFLLNGTSIVFSHYRFRLDIIEGTYSAATIPSYVPHYPGYKIPITVGNRTENVYLSKPLVKTGDTADYLDFKLKKAVYVSSDGEENVDLPNFTLCEGVNNFSVGTLNSPSGICTEYLSL